VSLYENNFYVVRESARGDLFADAERSGVIVVIAGPPSPDGSRDATILGGRVGCIVDASQNAADPSFTLETMVLYFDGPALETVLRETPSAFMDWLWSVAERLQPAVCFMMAGTDLTYFEAAQPVQSIMFRQLPELIKTGKVVAVHPIMYFAERVGEGALCRREARDPWSSVERRAGVGCLWLLVARDAVTGALDIMEPGNLYERLRSQFD
jgi:hypothetical protein